MGKALNSSGQLIELAVVSDVDRAAAVARKAARNAVREAQAAQQDLRRQVLDKLVTDAIAADPELATYAQGLNDVVEAKPGDNVSLPVKPAALSGQLTLTNASSSPSD